MNRSEISLNAARASQEMRRDTFAVLALGLAPAIGLGIARFAYALVLPDMRADLNWSYAEAGWLNASNAAGYLIGAMLCARAIERAGAYRVMAAGVWACVLALALCATTRETVTLNGARALAGLGGGFAFVAGGVLAARIAQRHPARSSLLLGLFYAGPGLGIMLSGLTVPVALDLFGSWRLAWAVQAVLALVLAVVLMRRREACAAEPAPAQTSAGQGVTRSRMLWLLGGYLLFGAGYIAYMTFMIAWVQGSGGGAGFQALFWAAIGAAAMASPWIWARLLGRLCHGHAFAVLTGMTAVGAALPLLSGAVATLFLSAVLFGSAFFAVVASTTAFVRRNLPPAVWASAIGTLTVAFGAGQVLGPIAIGAINDRTQALSGGLWASVFLLLAACTLGVLQRDFPQHGR